MKTISVQTGKPYQVLVGKGLLGSLGMQMKSITGAAKIAIISDSNVWPLYGEQVVAALCDAGYDLPCRFVFPAGEASKNGSTFLSILEFLANNHLTRTDCLIALGGGVVGDMTGFAAASYLRGIDYIQVPTSLLACVDSSVGGKTAIDLKAGKNLAGAFWQPRLVLCDTDLIATLTPEYFRDGCAEVIKYGVLYDRPLFDHLFRNGLEFDREYVISRCIELKRDVVAQDEFDTGARQKLNLGHTFGHGIEACSDFSVTHGHAVAIGMAMITRAAAKIGLCSADTARELEAVLCTFGLPIATEYAPNDIYRNALSDKKRSSNTIKLIIPTDIGNCILYPVPIEQMAEFITSGYAI